MPRRRHFRRRSYNGYSYIPPKPDANTSGNAGMPEPNTSLALSLHNTCDKKLQDRGPEERKDSKHAKVWSGDRARSLNPKP